MDNMIFSTKDSIIDTLLTKLYTLLILNQRKYSKNTTQHIKILLQKNNECPDITTNKRPGKRKTTQTHHKVPLSAIREDDTLEQKSQKLANIHIDKYEKYNK